MENKFQRIFWGYLLLDLQEDHSEMAKFDEEAQSLQSGEWMGTVLRVNLLALRSSKTIGNPRLQIKPSKCRIVMHVAPAPYVRNYRDVLFNYYPCVVTQVYQLYKENTHTHIYTYHYTHTAYIYNYIIICMIIY